MKPQNINLSTLYIIRHGQTDWNIQKLIQGHTDIQLNAEGEKQASELSKKLANIHFDAAFSSDLLRAKRTAEIALQEKKVAIEATELLRERCFGEIEGKSHELMYELEKLLENMSESERKNHKPDPRYESDNEVISRIITFLRQTSLAYPRKNVLISTHGGIIRLLLIHLGLIQSNQIPHIGNGCYLKLTSDGVDFFVEELNNIDLDKKFE